MLVVQKFGGSSVANAERVANVARRISKAYQQGHQLIVVLSAQGDTTDNLIAKAKEINSQPSKREMDMLMATGEQQSVALMAMALHKLGLPAVSLMAAQVVMHTNRNYSNARLKKIDTERIFEELERKNIVLVTGFQGINRYGDLTTLGRGGSDTTAVALAAACNAGLCEIYTDVEGVYTADPRMVKNAKKLDEITYDEMLELAALGAKVLHSRCVELAKKYNVKLVVRSSMSDAPGTLVKEDAKMESTYISGLAVDKNVARISVVSVPDKPGIAYRLFSMLAKRKISVDIILQSIGRNETKDITFTVAQSDLAEALEILEQSHDLISYDHISADDKIAKLSVVGAGMASNPGVAATMFEALFNGGINIQMISTSEIKISVLINEKDAENAANFVHDRFITEYSLDAKIN